jgi:hypothetical protein
MTGCQGVESVLYRRGTVYSAMGRTSSLTVRVFRTMRRRRYGIRCLGDAPVFQEMLKTNVAVMSEMMNASALSLECC